MKLSKTEQVLLDRAKSRHNGTDCVVRGCFVGRKNGSFGAREYAALCSLRDKGLVTITNTCNYIIYKGGGRTVRYYETTYKVVS